MPPMDKRIIKEHGLTDEEYEKIIKLIGREPNITELGIFSAMWNEHVSYKSSKIHLKNFPTKKKGVLQGPGENAGIIDIEEGWAVCFKMESHNHPSYIEPFQGAATGVGGILRDIFTMGARPIAILDSLRFGSINHPKTKYLLNGVVEGIAFYGNCVGVPTVGGELFFNEIYNKNCLVNVFCAGILRHEGIFRGIAKGKDNLVMYVGSKTGRDGIHGASMASEAFGEGTERKRPSVQVGDPFTEKLLLEACLEVMKYDAIVGIQDMGAAGLTCATFEMAQRGGVGMDIDLSLVPLRVEGMTPYEILLSESQERMLLVVKKEKIDIVKNIFKKWDLDAVVIGKIIDDDRMRMKFKGREVVSLPLSSVIKDAPIYQRTSKEPSQLKDRQNFDISSLKGEISIKESFKKLISSPNIVSKKDIYQRYDHMVQTRSVLLPEKGDSAVLRLMEIPQKGLAFTVDGNPRQCYIDPFNAGVSLVCEALLNISSVGAYPLGITDCLNFGNPEDPVVMWSFIEVIKGISYACKYFNVPVVSGNVSFYNETNGVSIYPTPTIAMVGIINDMNKTKGLSFLEDGSLIAIAGEFNPTLGGSEYLSVVYNIEKGRWIEKSLDKELAIQNFITNACEKDLILSAHDVSDGGMAIALFEKSLTSKNPLCFSVDLSSFKSSPEEILFGEGSSSVILSFHPSKERELLSLAELFNVRLKIIGKVGGSEIIISPFFKIDIDEVLSLWSGSL